MRKQRGFTLVEVGIAAAVLATISALAVVALRGMRQRGGYGGVCLTGGLRPASAWVRFAPGAAPAATFSGATASPFGQQLTVRYDNGTQSFMMVIGILARSGAVFSKEQVL